jgi:Tfp pilus assembly protein PilO
MNLRFDERKRKDIIIVSIFVLFVLSVFQFIYFPKVREVKRLNSEYVKAKAEIEGLYDFIGGEANLKDNIIKIRKERHLLEQAFPYEKDVSNIIRQLNEEAGHFKVNVISLKPKNLEITKGENGEELEIWNYFCKCMPLVLKVESRYKDLGEFLISLETKKSPMISVQEVNIGKDEDIAPRIKADIELMAYLLGK